ncbi:hypothetical protein [Halorientalis salina]|uniref:hypothetical protein n=1 Tax=Halorientalis salina TaxID=2932266 RepID=UPI0010AC8DAD|nr:hypothetical protein [Halorientalis salina]
MVPRTRPLPTAIAIAVLAVTVIAVGSAAPPPQSVCEPCVEDLEWSGYRHGVALQVTESNATMRVHENGSATWTVTSRFTRAAGVERSRPNTTLRDPSTLQQNRTLRRTVVREVIGADRGDTRLQSLRVNDSTIRFTYHESDVARRTPGGVLLVERYYTRSMGSGWYVDVDRLTVVGPPGTVVSNDVTDAVGSSVATTDGRRFVLRGETRQNSSMNRPIPDSPSLDRSDFFVAFADPGPTAGVATALGIASVTLPFVVVNFVAYRWVGTGILLVALGAVATVRTRRGNPLGKRTLALWAGGTLGSYLLLTLFLLPPSDAPPFVSFMTGVFSALAVLFGFGSWFSYGWLSSNDGKSTGAEN